MDTHANTYCAGANWSLMELTGEICNINPFLDSYNPESEIPVARCCTIWTDQYDSQEYLLVGDQMLWFEDLLPNSLINLNQVRAYGIDVNDDLFNSTRKYGIDSEYAFIPFNTMGMLVHFELRVLTKWEKTHLPIILMTGDTWNPSKEVLQLGKKNRESVEMRTIQSLTSGMTKQQIRSVIREEVTTQSEKNGEVEIQLGNISFVYNPREFCEQLISAVNIVTTY